MMLQFFVSKQLDPYVHWTAKIENLFTLQMNFLQPSALDLLTEDSNPNLSPVK